MIRFDVEGETQDMNNKWMLLPLAAALLLTSCQSASGAVIYHNQSLALAERVEQTVRKSTEIQLSANLGTCNPDAPEQEAFSSCLHFVEANRERYLLYQEAHPDLSEWDIVTQVNIGLDHPYYTNVQTVSDPNSLLVLCNKYWKLPDGYEPSDLRKLSSKVAVGSANQMRAEAADAFERLCADAKKEGYTIFAQSAYRSYSRQVSLYNQYAARDGVEGADTYSSRAGHSDHQTGLVVDVKNASLPYNRFGETAEYQWAKDNIHKYGFIIHYPPGKEGITGYQTEEWHWRYVGQKAATEIYNLGLTLDEYCAIFLANSSDEIPSLLSDTPDALTLSQGSSYTFSFQPAGALAVPTFTTGDGTIVTTSGFQYRSGSYLLSVQGLAPGSTNLYATFDGQAPIRLCSITVRA